MPLAQLLARYLHQLLNLSHYVLSSADRFPAFRCFRKPFKFSVYFFFSGNGLPVGVCFEFGIFLDEKIALDYVGKYLGCLGVCFLIFDLQLDFDIAYR